LQYKTKFNIFGNDYQFNIVRLLLASSIIYLTKITEAEVELKENVQKLLLDVVFQYNGLEITEEIYFDYQEPYKLYNFLYNILK